MCKREEQAVRKSRGGKIKRVSDKAHIILQPLQDTVFSGLYHYNKDIPEDKGAHLKVALDKIKFQPEPLTVNFGRQ